MRIAWLILVLLGTVGAARPQQQVSPSDTQMALDQAAGAELKTAEAEMASVLDALTTSAAGHPGSIGTLNAAQAAWVKYRDAQLTAEWPNPGGNHYGSAYPMCVATERARLTKLRVVELRSMLAKAEGDACSPQWPD